MSTPVNKGREGVKNTQNPVNVVYEQPLRLSVCLPAPATPRVLNIKSVYVVSNSWYGQIIVRVCIGFVYVPTLLSLSFLDMPFFNHELVLITAVYKTIICKIIQHNGGYSAYLV